MKLINLTELVESGDVKWVLGQGKALVQDESLELAFYNHVNGEANNSLHHHNLSTERLLIIKGGMLLEINGKEYSIGEMELICIEPGEEHRIISYQEGTYALNMRNSKLGAVGHLVEDR